jgi:pyrimidine precursor biosynthesis enzyme
MRAVKRGAELLHRDPVTAWSKYCDVKPIMKSELHALQFERSFNYMSVDLANVQRDWNKVTNYSSPNLPAD